MHRRPKIVAAVLCVAPLASAQDLALREDGHLRVELSAEDPSLDGAGPSRSFTYECDFAGRVNVWATGAATGAASGEGVDPLLVVESAPEGRVLRDLDSGGGTTAFLSVEVLAGQTLAIRVAATLPDQAGEVEVRVVACPELDETFLAAEKGAIALNEVRRLLAARDGDGARQLLEDTVRSMLERETLEGSVAGLLDQIATTAGKAGFVSLEREVREALVAYWQGRLPETHPTLTDQISTLALAVRRSGDYEAASELLERILATELTCQPADAEVVQVQRHRLASTLRRLGELDRARELCEAAIAAYARHHPDDHYNLNRTRATLAFIVRDQGDPQAAMDLQERVLEVMLETRPGSSSVRSARVNLANTARMLGFLERARELQETLLAEVERIRPEEHPELALARNNLALTLHELGEYGRALELQQKVLAAREKTLPGGHPQVLTSRANLAMTLESFGQLAAARRLLESVLDQLATSLPPEHEMVRKSRGNLALVIKQLGDMHAARALEESLLDVLSRSLPDDHHELRAVRANLAITYKQLGELERARALQEKVLETLAAGTESGAIDLQYARSNLAGTCLLLGDLERAGELFRLAIEAFSGEHGDDHLGLARARQGYATVLLAEGELDDALRLQESVVRAREALPESSADRWSAHLLLARIAQRAGQAERVTQAALVVSEMARAAILEQARTHAPREVTANALIAGKILSDVLSLAGNAGDDGDAERIVRECFTLVEAYRGVGLLSSRFLRAAADDENVAAFRSAARRANDAVVRLAASGARADELAGAVRKRDGAQRALLGALAGESSGVVVGFEAFRELVRADEALVGYWRYDRTTHHERLNEQVVPSLLAFVLRGDGVLARVELGDVATIDAAVERWRAAVLAPIARGVSPGKPAGSEVEVAGEELRRLVLDPLREPAGDARRWIVALDDALHLVPLDALPVGGGPASNPSGPSRNRVVGDELAIEVRSTLWELVLEGADVQAPSTGTLVAMGGIDYDFEPQRVALNQISAGAARGATRGEAWDRGFAPLVESSTEVKSLARLYDKTLGTEVPSRILEESLASRDSLLTLAPQARFLHLATHGYFAPESIVSIGDPRPIDEKTGIGTFATGEERARGLSPMVLCGLALAGANLEPDSMGRVAGIVTAEEIAMLDLRGCELAVLSACETNVGVRRAGQGVASLQRALHMAGARGVITSLWKVSDAATRELMVDFYRRLWVQGKPKGQALWEAKQRLRDARDASGAAVYRMHDWAGWVLSGEAQ